MCRPSSSSIAASRWASVCRRDFAGVRRSRRKAEVNAIRLRPATSADAGFAYELLEQTMRGYAEATWGGWLEGPSREEMTRTASDGRSQVVELDAVRVGLLRLEEFTTHWQLEQLFVLPSYQRRGIGKWVLDGLLERAR